MDILTRRVSKGRKRLTLVEPSMPLTSSGRHTLRSRSERRLSRREFAIHTAALFGATLSYRYEAAAQSPDAKGKSKSVLLTKAAREGVDKGLEFLLQRQNDDGSFGTGDYSRNVAVVALCGMAYLAQGSTPTRGKYNRAVRKALEFLLENSDASGLVNVAANTDRGPMYGHGFATLFLAETFGTAHDLGIRDTVTKAVRLIVNCQNAEGGWRYEARPEEADISVTVCQVMALRAAKNAGFHVPTETIDRAVQFIKQCQNPDGGFNYMLALPHESRFPRSAAAVVALMGAGLYGSDEVRRGIEYLRQQTPIISRSADQSYFLYGQYYAAQAMWNVGGDDWQKWYVTIRDLLLAKQKSDGVWEDAISPEYGTAMACLVLNMPTNYLPIFQR